jgi:hypothetical protein
MAAHGVERADDGGLVPEEILKVAAGFDEQGEEVGLRFVGGG